MGPIRLGVVHIMQGSLAGSDSWFHEPQAQVSAHFGVGKDGTVYQWVDTSQVAWAEMGYNDAAISIEHEGDTGDSLTPQQIVADAALVNWLRATHGIPKVMTANPMGTGWIGHGQLGVAGGNHPDCPGTPILAQWPEVLNSTPAPPVPNPHPVNLMEMFTMNCQDPTSGGTWIVDPTDGHVETAFGAPYLGGMNEPTADRDGWKELGYIAGIGPWKDPQGQYGYAIWLRLNKVQANGSWYSPTGFARDGSSK